MLLCGAGCCLLTRGFLGAGPGRGAGLHRGHPAVFGRPRRELDSALRLVVLPGPAAHGHRSPAFRLPQVPFMPVVGVLHYMKPSGGVSSPCRTLV